MPEQPKQLFYARGWCLIVLPLALCGIAAIIDLLVKLIF